MEGVVVTDIHIMVVHMEGVIGGHLVLHHPLDDLFQSLFLAVKT